MNTLIIVSLLYSLNGLTGRQSNAIFSDIEKSDKNLSAAQQRLDQLELQQVQLQHNVADTESKFGEAKLLQGISRKHFATRLRALSNMPTGARFVLLGGAHSLGDYLSMKRILHGIANHDKQLQQNYLKQANAYKSLEHDLRAQRYALDELLGKLTQERDRVAQIRDQRIQLLRRVTSEKTLQKLAIKERSRARKLLAKMVQRLRPQAATATETNGRQNKQQKSNKILFSAQQKKLPWPTVGRLYTLFGRQVERRHATVTTNNGIDIIAPVGSTVQAVAAGTVVYSDWFRGYGQIVIIDHGEDYHTLSAHLNGRLVEVGEVVKQGQTIGTVGETGSITGSGLYFEIRYQGTPKNPQYWLRK